MTAGSPSSAPQPGSAPALRRALVLGSGGVLGFAWMLGALGALEVETGFRAGDCELILGTSAGSVGAALLACGVTVDQIRRHHEGVPLPGDPSIMFNHDTATGSAFPPRPQWRPGSPGLLLDALRHPRDARPIVALAGMLPAGRATLAPVTSMVVSVAEQAGVEYTWPARPQPWIAATDYTTGKRVVFGRDDVSSFVSEPVALSTAVTASCSIPLWYPPVAIGRHTFIDGGAISNASIDLLADVDVDEVYIFAPMASVQITRHRSPAGRVERALRRSVTRGVLADVALLRAQGKRVAVVTPGPEDLDVMGLNLMNSSKRHEVLQTSMHTSLVQLRGQLSSRAFTHPQIRTAGA